MGGGSVTFQPQNPAKSGDRSTYVDARGNQHLAGWANCTAFVAAMGAEFDSGVKLTGTQVRQESSEPVPDPRSPGLDLSQIAAVLGRHGIDLDVERGIAFDDLDDMRRAGHAIGLQLDYGPIQHTTFSGDPMFGDGHIVLWLPSGDVFDPLDDGRRPGIAKSPVRIPVELLREAAGKLVLDAAGRTVGLGKAYAGIFPTAHPVGGVPLRATRLTFGATEILTGEYRVVVRSGFVRTSPGGVPGRANFVGRKAASAAVHVFGTTKRGQRVAGSRVWHQVNDAGTRFMHSSVIKLTRAGEAGEPPGSLDTDDEPPMVDDPDANSADDAGNDDEESPPSPKTDVPGEADPSGLVAPEM